MKEFNKNNTDTTKKEQKEEPFSIPNEASCSPEFPQGCVFDESDEDSDNSEKVSGERKS
jgi:hypothetical protein